MREIPVAVACGRHPLVDLDDVDLIPGHILVGKRTQHHSGCMPSAESGSELSARGSSFPSLSGNETRRCAGGAFWISKDFDFHESISRSPPNISASNRTAVMDCGTGRSDYWSNCHERALFRSCL